MTKRLRLVGVTIVPQVVIDEGDQLAPFEVKPTFVAAAHWPTVVEDLAEALDQLAAATFDAAAPTPLNRAGRRRRAPGGA